MAEQDLLSKLKRSVKNVEGRARKAKENSTSISTSPPNLDVPEHLRETFDELPVNLDTFLYDKAYLGIEPLSEKQYEFIAIGSQVYKPETLELLGWTPVRSVSELVVEWGKGSGKDFCSAILTARVVYLIQCLKYPLVYYGQSKASHIDILNMAYSGEQAESNFFAYLKDIIELAPWFKGKYAVRANRLEFPKKIKAWSGNSFEEAFEGKNLMVCVLDEIGAFKTSEEIEAMKKRRMRAPRYAADAVYDMAGSSIASRFPGGIGKLISISFPRYQGDFIQQLYEKRKDDPSTLTSFGATWEINPKRTRADFDDEYRKNPERAVGRYECKPSGKLDSFFSKPEILDEVFKTLTEEESPITSYNKGRSPKLKPWYKATHGCRCSVHIDLGWKFCSAGVAMAHCCDIIREGDAELPVIEADIVTSFIAPVNGEIDFEEVRQFVMSLRDVGFYIACVTFDGYQSVYMMQMFTKMGIESKLRSVVRTPDAYEDLKAIMYAKRLRGYFLPRTLEMAGQLETRYPLKDELMNLVGLGDGKAPDHRCLSGDTRISLVSGEEVSIKEMYEGGQIGKKFWVYSIANSGVVPVEVSEILQTGRNVGNMIEVELDNGEKITCTPDHLFMMRGGDYVKAKDLKENDSLMPLYRKKEAIAPGSKVVVNHKVVSVSLSNKGEDVYDLVVPFYHNFALSSGVFVHNSGSFGKDEGDALAGAVQGAVELGFSGAVKESDVELGREDRESFMGSEAIGDREFLSPMH